MTANSQYKKFEVRHPDHDGDEWMEIEATDPEDAALQYAQSFDSGGDYTLLKGDKEQIAVRRQGEEAVQWYEISGESVPQYYAYTMEPPGSQEET